MRIGAHVDQADPIGDARAAGIDAIQIMLGDPQSWKGPTFAHPGGAAGLRAEAEDAGVDIYVHSPYLINVATTNNRVRIPSRKLLQKNLDAAAEIGAKGVVVHGGHVTKDDDPEAGFENWFKCIDRLEMPVPVLLENTAGGANAMARRFDRLERVWQAIQAASGAENVGFCLDTCHAHAAGEDLSGIVDRVIDITGRIDLIHCNDSRDAFGSGADRHENLGSGQADGDAIGEVLRSAGAPIILETPPAGRADDLAWVRAALASPQPA